jgi:hypothetical protein
LGLIRNDEMNLKRVVLILVAVTAMVGALAAASHVGTTFEEKTLFSYMLKTGDTNPQSASALSHIHGSRMYGLTVAFQVALCSAVLGILGGLAWARRRRRDV